MEGTPPNLDATFARVPIIGLKHAVQALKNLLAIIQELVNQGFWG